MDDMTRAAGPGGSAGGLGGYTLTHTGAEVDAAVTGWQTAQAQADATADDIAEGKKAITGAGLVTGTMQAGGGEPNFPDIPTPESAQEKYMLVWYKNDGGSLTISVDDRNTWTYSIKNVAEGDWSYPVETGGGSDVTIPLNADAGKGKAFLIKVVSTAPYAYWSIMAQSTNQTCCAAGNLYYSRVSISHNDTTGVTSADYRAAYNLVTTGQEAQP